MRASAGFLSRAVEQGSAKVKQKTSSCATLNMYPDSKFRHSQSQDNKSGGIDQFWISRFLVDLHS